MSNKSLTALIVGGVVGIGGWDWV
ncbi:hypothetical protein ACIQRH_24355, partial [Pseudomonas sp. NPDC090964]